MRTEVGLRCPACAQTAGVRVRGARRWPAVAAVIAAMAVVALVLLRVAGRNEAPAPTTASTLAGLAPVRYHTLTRTDLRYSLDVPESWTAAPDNSGSTTSYAASPPSLGSVRVSLGRDDSPLPAHVQALIDALRQQGGVNFVQTSLDISGLAAIRLDYRFPATPSPGAPMTAHTSYLVKRDSLTVVSFQLATNSPAAQGAVFSHMASSFQIL
ncbi:MAG TPA: hypothetical protein VHT75_07255 [Acidimicrobiales bacterium]|nr:hypothetical protein [Acidimicrobiales bacterium]